jgi:hypothetical protein
MKARLNEYQGATSSRASVLGAAVCAMLVFSAAFCATAANRGNDGPRGPSPGGGRGHPDLDDRGGRGNLGNPGILPPQARVCGLTYGQWGARWWQWVYNIPNATNPVGDTNGQFAALDQHGPVWFLAGSWGDKVERTVTVPAGKFIFFPVCNVSFWNPDDFGYALSIVSGLGMDTNTMTTDQIFLAATKWYEDQANGLEATIDGVAVKNLEKYRAEAPKLVPISNALLTSQGLPDIPRTITSDGYWLMLAPPRPGQHTIHFSVGGGLDVTYHLTVKKEGCPEGPGALGKCLAKFEEVFWRWACGDLTLPVDANTNAVVCGDVVMMPIPGSPGDGTPASIDVTINEDQAFMLPLWVWLGTDYTDGSVDPPVDLDVFRTMDISFTIDKDTVVSTKNVMKYYADFDFVSAIPYPYPPYVSVVYFQGIGVLHPGLSPGKHTMKLHARNTVAFQDALGNVYSGIEYNNTWNVTVKPCKDHGNHK